MRGGEGYVSFIFVPLLSPHACNATTISTPLLISNVQHCFLPNRTQNLKTDNIQWNTAEQNLTNHYISHSVLLLEEEDDDEEELVPSEDVDDTDPSSLELGEVLFVIDVPRSVESIVMLSVPDSSSCF